MRWVFGVTLIACVVASLFCLVYPMYVIRPFRAQGGRELAVALAVMRVRTLLTLVSALAVVGAVGFCWRSLVGWRRRVLPVLAAIVACAVVVLARVNVYELMFHPIEAASFSPAAEVRLDAREKVIAVRVGGVARAYPIRSLSYHHMINDEIDKVAIIATY